MNLTNYFQLQTFVFLQKSSILNFDKFFIRLGQNGCIYKKRKLEGLNINKVKKTK